MHTRCGGQESWACEVPCPTEALLYYLLLVVKHHDQKQVGEERVYFIVLSIMQGNQGGKPEVETAAEAVGKRLLPCSPVT